MRDVSIKVTPRARKKLVKEEGDTLKIYTTSPALEGRANDAVVEALAAYWGIRKSQLEIIRGLKSRHKVVRINE